MSVEFNKIADTLAEQGYHQGAQQIRAHTQSLLKQGLIPATLTPLMIPENQNTIESPAGSHQIIAQTKIGPYLNPVTLEGIAYGTSTEYSKSLRRYTEYLLEQIEDFGEQSIAHLCVSAKTTHALSKAGVHTIDDGVRKAIQSGKLVGIKNIGFKSAQELRSALNAFDKTREEYLQSQGTLFSHGGGI